VIGMFLLLCIFIVFWTSIFSCIALLINDYKQRDFILSVVMTPLIFAAPLFYSLDNAPMILQVISRCNPLTYQLELIRDVMIGYFDWGLLVFFLIISIIALLFSGSALKRVDYTNEEH
ncbi:MAG: ABC transporter permease, partial [Atopobium sp.]|nr:ABC transporter permease [Atopobium sp.]